MKNKTLIFPVFILLLSPFVWYSSQPGIDEKKGLDFLMSPGCFICLIVMIVGGVVLRNKRVFLIGNLIFIPTMFLYVYNQGMMFEGNAYTVMEIVCGVQPGGIAIIGITVAGCLLSIVEMTKEHSSRSV